MQFLHLVPDTQRCQASCRWLQGKLLVLRTFGTNSEPPRELQAQAYPVHKRHLQLFAVLFCSALAKREREARTARDILFILRPATTDSILPRHRNTEVRARRANITSASPARAQKRLLLSAAVPAAAPAGGYLGQAHAALAPFHSSFVPRSL